MEYGNSYDFAIGEVRGYRRWDVKPDGTLTSPYQGTPWKDGENVAFHADDPSIYDYGFFSFNLGKIRHHLGIKQNDPFSIGGRLTFVADDFELGHVPGVVRGYGYVTEGSKGFQAQKAVIESLVYKDRPVKQFLWKNRIWLTISGFFTFLACVIVGPMLVTLGDPIGLALLPVALATFVFSMLISFIEDPGVPLKKILDKYPNLIVFDSMRAMHDHYADEIERTEAEREEALRLKRKQEWLREFERAGRAKRRYLEKKKFYEEGGFVARPYPVDTTKGEPTSILVDDGIVWRGEVKHEED